MKKLLIILMFVPLVSFGQDEEKIYFDSDWKRCSQSEASYYRLLTIDENRKSIGLVKDYFISGNIQFEGKMSYVDEFDDGKSKSDGLCKWFNEDGSINHTSEFSDGLRNGKTIYFYSDGRKTMEYKYSNNILTTKFVKECIDLECSYLYVTEFNSDDSWEVEENENQKISRMYVKNKSNLKYFIQNKTDDDIIFSESPVDVSDNDGDFQISVDTQYWNGLKASTYWGFYFGFKDYDNHYRLLVSTDNDYKIIHKVKGIDIGKGWTKIDNNINSNRLNVVRLNGKLLISIDGELVYTSDNAKLRGNKIRLFVSSSSQVAFDNFKVVIDDSSYNENYPKQGDTSSISYNWKGNGSGFFISQTGYIVTNYHVVKDANEIEVEYEYSGEIISHKAKIIKNDPNNDLSIIKINDDSFKKLSPLPYNFKTRSADVGSEVYALGYPMALSGMGKDIKFTDGKISSKTGYNGDIRTYQTTTPIQGGNSGGPLFDYYGNLVGINSSKITSDKADNVSYAIKSSYLLSLIDVIPENINLPSSKLLNNKKLTEQIKYLSPYVVLIKVK